jgi:hypothetical protein
MPVQEFVMSQHDPSSSREQPHGSEAGQRPSVQSRGGIGRAVSSAADAAASGDTGWIRGAVDVPGPSLDDGGGKRPHDGRAHQGLTGDDGAHQATDSSALPASASTDPAADLGRAHDRRHDISDDPAERTTGGDRPNDGGRMTGAPGGPSPTVPRDLPGDDEALADDIDSAAHGGEDATRDQQI